MKIKSSLSKSSCEGSSKCQRVKKEFRTNQEVQFKKSQVNKDKGTTSQSVNHLLYNFCSDILSLPVPILENILGYLHIKDLLNVICVHPYLQDVVTSSHSVWRNVKFTHSWPSKQNKNLYERASSKDNFEATVKLGVAYLYNEGLPYDVDGSNIEENGRAAAEMFLNADRMSQHSAPFSWLLYRPPWSVKNCCKAMVYSQMKKRAMSSQEYVDSDLLCSVAKIAIIEQDYNLALCCLNRAVEQSSSVHTSYLKWKLCDYLSQCSSHDNASEARNRIQYVRDLRSIISMGRHLDATFSLLNLYMNGDYGGLEVDFAAEYSRGVFQASKPESLHRVYSPQSPVTTSMRFILVDWLIEVATVKDFTTHTLHQSISMMDEYMKRNKSVPRSELQLLGIVCLIICSRYTSNDVITIYEACWLTDNTYRYQDVVKMMASVIVSLRGNMRSITVLDYVQPLCRLIKCSQREASLAEYICELALMHTELTIYKQSYIAASCVLLAKLMLTSETVWSELCTSFTGLLLQDLRQPLLHIHEKCFIEEAPKDHRDLRLDSVRTRYSSEKYHCVSSIAGLSRDKLIMGLGGDSKRDDWMKKAATLRLRNQPYLIMSPSRDDRYSQEKLRCDAGTPPPVRRKSNAANDSTASLVSTCDKDTDYEDFSYLESDAEDSFRTSFSQDDGCFSENKVASSSSQKLEPSSCLAINLLSPIGAISAHKSGLGAGTSKKLEHSTSTAVASNNLLTASNVTPWCSLVVTAQTKRNISSSIEQNSSRRLKPKH